MVFYLFSFSLSTLADGEKVLAGYDAKVDVISEKYDTGPFLIYDCEDRHWVCVMESYFNECKEKRLKAISEFKEDLPCAPVGEFPVKKSCFQRELFMVTHNYGTDFCKNPHWREKSLNF